MYVRLHQVLLLCLVCFAESQGAAATISLPVFLDPSFESYPVPNGSHRPRQGVDDPPWNFRYENSFVVDPFFAPRYQGVFNAQAASHTPHDGQQYVSTYAGAAGIGQLLTFTLPGTYRVSAYAASPSGNLEHHAGEIYPMVGGQFRFRVDNILVGETRFVSAGGPWSRFDALIEITSPGVRWVGVDNTLSAVYFIYYDSFAIEPVRIVPEPMSTTLTFFAAVMGISGARRRGWL